MRASHARVRGDRCPANVAAAAAGAWVARPMPHRVLFVLSVLAALTAVAEAVVGCLLEDDRCICKDALGTEWDLTDFNEEFGTEGDTTGCSICVPPYNYIARVCNNVSVPQSLGCVTTANTAMYRIDSFAGTPTSRSCEVLGPDVEGTGALGVVGRPDEDGVVLTYSYLTRTVTLEIVCDRDGSVRTK